MWNCFVRCRCCRNATAFLSASDVDTVIKVNYDHSVCLDPITIIISVRQTIIGGGGGGGQEAASGRTTIATTPSSRPASFGQSIVLFCQSAPPPPNERSHQKK